MDRPQIVGTPATRDLCESIARQYNGVCLLHFSRGKDSVAAWLFMRQFFKRIIPIFFNPLPGMPIIERSLKYYEDFFETPIIRCIAGDALIDLNNLLLQTPDREEAIDNLKLRPFTREEATDVIREAYGLKGVPYAKGTGYYDAINRRIAFMKVKGFDRKHLVFSPIYDWRKETLWQALEASGVKLAPDYRFANRTFSGGPKIGSVTHMEQFYPEDYKRLKVFYPLVDGLRARNEFRMAQNGTQKE